MLVFVKGVDVIYIPPILIVKKTPFLDLQQILAVVQACKMMNSTGIFRYVQIYSEHNN